jgi:hypothetical protein
MSSSVLGLSIDCGDAAKLAQFWADVLGSPINPDASAEFAAIDPEGAAPRWPSTRYPKPRRSKTDCIST